LSNILNEWEEHVSGAGSAPTCSPADGSTWEIHTPFMNRYFRHAAFNRTLI